MVDSVSLLGKQMYKHIEIHSSGHWSLVHSEMLKTIVGEDSMERVLQAPGTHFLGQRGFM